MKTIFINTQLTQYALVEKEIQQLFEKYDHVKVQNRALRITWNFYKPKEEKIVVEKKPIKSVEQKKEKTIVQKKSDNTLQMENLQKKVKNTINKNLTQKINKQ